MKSITAVFLTFFVFSSNCDVIDSALSKAIAIKNLIGSNQGYPGRKSVRQITPRAANSRGYLQKISSSRGSHTIPLNYWIKRGAFFPEGIVEKSELSSDGQKIACLCEGNSTRYIKIVSVENGMVQTIKESSPIDEFTFIGRNLLYFYRDKDNSLKVCIWTSSGKKLIKAPEDSISARILAKNDKACLIEVYDGDKYNLCKISPNFAFKQIKEFSEPILSIFDSNLAPALIIKYENETYCVYVKPPKQKSDNVPDEDSVSIGDEDSDEDLVLIDQIDDLKTSMCLSVDRTGHYYKANIDQEGLKIFKINVKTQESSIFYSLRGVNSFEQCSIFVNADKIPIFAIVNNNRLQVFSCNGNFKRHINSINSKFESWCPLSISRDGNTLLLSSLKDTSPDQFFIYNAGNFTLRAISKLNVGTWNKYLRKTECRFVSRPNNEHIQLFFTKGIDGDRNSPLIVIVNSATQYKWKYMPLVQLLANRGCNVICINCRKDPSRSIRNTEDDTEPDYDSISMEVADIVKAVQWAAANNMGKIGNIILLAENQSSFHAMHAFVKNQRVFAGGIFVPSNSGDLQQILQKIENSENEISKPTLFLKKLDNPEEDVSSITEKIPQDSCTFIGFGKKDPKLLAAMVEAFSIKIMKSQNGNLSKKKIEPLTPQEVKNILRSSDGLDLLDEFGNKLSSSNKIGQNSEDDEKNSDEETYKDL